MNWYRNMRIKSKLLASFGLVIIVSIVMVAFAVMAMKNLGSRYKLLISGPIHARTYVISVGRNFSRANLNLQNIVGFFGSKDELNSDKENLNYFVNEAIIELGKYKDSINSDESLDKKFVDEQITWADELIADIKNNYIPLCDHIVSTIYTDKDKAMQDTLVVNKIVDEINDHLDQKGTELNDLFDDQLYRMQRFEDASHVFMNVFSGFLTTITILITLYVAKVITKPIKQLMRCADKVVNGDFSEKIAITQTNDEIDQLSNHIAQMVSIFEAIINEVSKFNVEFSQGDIEARLNSEGFHGRYKDIIDSINNLVNIFGEDNTTLIGYMKNIGEGIFDFEVKKFPGKKVILTNTITNVQSNLIQVSNEINNLIKQATAGNLNCRFNSNQYQGDWKNIMDALNMLVTAISIPLREVQHVLSRIEEGDFSAKMEGKFEGEFATMQSSLNQTTHEVGSYITEISEILKDVSNGNLKKGIIRNYVGQYDQIKLSINNIIQTLNRVICDIGISANNVLSGANQISLSSIDLANGATKQTSSIAELMSSIKMISEKTQLNTTNSQTATELSDRSIENARLGNEDMDRMLSSMDGIKESSNNISKLTKVIEEIAFQINLLAFNASIEASRAGQYGRGFSVVAGEVRNLALRSQEAVSETTQLIEESIEKVDTGTKIANITASALNTIINDVVSISKMINQIFSSTKEQGQAIYMVNDEITEISSVVQSNSAASEETASAAEELVSLSQALTNAVSYFTV